MKKLFLLIVIAIASIQLTACSEDDEVNPDKLEISVQDNSLELKNRSRDDLYLFIVDRNALALILWAPSVEGDPQLEGKSTITVDFEDISAYTEDTEEVVVHFWKAITEDGERVHSEIESKVVEIR